MAKIDVTQISGYENMTAEEKLKALEGYDIPDADYSGYIKKDTFDRTASELASLKKQMRDKMSEDEKKKAAEEEELTKLRESYDALLKESTISKNKAKYIALGYDETLAEETATALLDGDMDKVFANQQKHLASVEKKLRADILKDTKRPVPDGGLKTMTLDALRKLSADERAKFYQEHPEEYRELYQGGNG